MKIVVDYLKARFGEKSTGFAGGLIALVIGAAHLNPAFASPLVELLSAALAGGLFAHQEAKAA